MTLFPRETCSAGSLVAMLVVSRRAGESVVIGDDVIVTILEVRGDVVRVGIDAPRSIAVHRAELLAQLESSNQEAASPERRDRGVPDPGSRQPRAPRLSLPGCVRSVAVVAG